MGEETCIPKEESKGTARKRRRGLKSTAVFYFYRKLRLNFFYSHAGLARKTWRGIRVSVSRHNI